MTLSHQELADLQHRAAAGDRLATLINQPELNNFLRGVQVEAVYQVERWGAAHDRGKRPADWFWLIGYLTGKALHAANAQVLPRYRHIRRGTTYELLTEGDNENSPGEHVVIYRGEADGKVWVRPAAQFHDGRFEPLSPKPNDRALHHCISAAAALYNWHCAIAGVDTSTLSANSDGEPTTAAAFPGEAAATSSLAPQETIEALQSCLDVLLRMIPDACAEHGMESCTNEEHNQSIARAGHALYGPDRKRWPAAVRSAAEGRYE